MKHKHAKMIKAKVDNMDLVIFVKLPGRWGKSESELPTHGGDEYFLCHPKHADTCLHWLNGGKTQFCPSDRFFNMSGFNENKWHPNHTFMDEDLETRIKPKKEKRWIIVSKSQGSGVGVIYNDCSGAYKFESDAIIANNALSELNKNTQIIEIEIEVE